MASKSVRISADDRQVLTGSRTEICVRRQGLPATGYSYNKTN